MIHRRTMLEEPHIAPDGTLCYFNSTLADFDWFAADDRMSWLGTMGIGRPARLHLLSRSRLDGSMRPDDLILWPTDEERHMRSLYAERDRTRLASYEEMGVNVDARLP